MIPRAEILKQRVHIITKHTGNDATVLST